MNKYEVEDEDLVLCTFQTHISAKHFIDWVRSLPLKVRLVAYGMDELSPGDKFIGQLVKQSVFDTTSCGGTHTTLPDDVSDILNNLVR